jgi:hypothetical protein
MYVSGFGTHQNCAVISGLPRHQRIEPPELRGHVALGGV